jgi:hypothetical protein
MHINFTEIQFPELKLRTRDAHKLRGYFGNLFKEHSPLLHNHLESGEQAYQYPMVQYKVLKGMPVLIGLDKGARLLVELFLWIKELNIGGETYTVNQKNIGGKKVELRVDEDLHEYEFQTLWMPLNQANHRKYVNGESYEKSDLLKSILTGNILSFYKFFNYRVDKKIMVKQDLKECNTKFKDNIMLAFEGKFITNAIIPDHVGIGKAVSRGFGTVKRQ